MAINMPTQRSTPIEGIAQGVSILKNLGLIGNDKGLADLHAQQAQALREETERKKQEFARSQSGEISMQEFLKEGKNFQAAKEGEPGALSLYVRSAGGPSGEESVLTKYVVKPREREDSPLDTLAKSLTIQQKQRELGDVKPDQAKAALFTKRLEQAENVFNELEKSGHEFSGIGVELQKSSLFPERLKSEGVKSQDQAERNFVNALLRRESGSAIGKDEFDSASKQYFPRAGDTPEILEQKRQNRALAIEGLKAEAGRAYSQIGDVQKRQVAQPRQQDSRAKAAPKVIPHPQDNEALQWAKQNPNDPRAIQILQLNKVR